MVQLFVQVYTNMPGFMVHDIHGWKLHQVKIPIQQTVRFFDFQGRGYNQISGRCTHCFVAAWKLHKTFGILHQDDLLHPTRRVVPSIYTPCTPPYEIMLIWEFLEQPHPPLVLHLLCEVVYTSASSVPSLCSWSIWFQVVWAVFLRVLNSGRRIKTMVGFELYC
jgi:hypothetical protein